MILGRFICPVSLSPLNGLCWRVMRAGKTLGRTAVSYGYLIASPLLVPEIQKHRRFKFSLLDSSDDFHIYSRLEEGGELSVRNGYDSVLTDAGKSLLSDIRRPFFFMDYLLGNRQGEYDLIEVVRKDVKTGNFKTVSLSGIRSLVLNGLYKVAL